MPSERVEGLVKAVYGVVHVQLAGHERKFTVRVADVPAAAAGDLVAAIFEDGHCARLLVADLKAGTETPIEVGGEL